MFGYPTFIVFFTVGAFSAWASALLWARSQPKSIRWYHYWVLSLTTVFWWVAESIAIRLGKYEYSDKFPAGLPMGLGFPWGGTPEQPGALTEMLRRLLPADDPRPWLVPGCSAHSFDIPLPVVALEAALLFGLFHLARRLYSGGRGNRLRAAVATGGVCGLLLLNATAILDPVVSTNQWCSTSPDPNYHYLSFGLWNWFTTERHPGYWFGVPPVNYAGWFLAATVFGFLARLDDERDTLLIRRYPALAFYLVASVLAIVIVFGALIPVKVAVDRLLDLQLAFGQKGWQFTVLLLLLGLGLLASAVGRRQRDFHFEPISSVPKLLIFAYCLGLLLRQPHTAILSVWFATLSIAAIVLFWPFLVNAIDRRRSGVASRKPRSEDPGARV